MGDNRQYTDYGEVMQDKENLEKGWNNADPNYVNPDTDRYNVDPEKNGREYGDPNYVHPDKDADFKDTTITKIVDTGYSNEYSAPENFSVDGPEEDPNSYTDLETSFLQGDDIPQEYFDIIKGIERGIVPEGTEPNADTLETSRQLYRSETQNDHGGDLFNLYAKMRYEQLTNPRISPKSKAKLFEEFMTVVTVVGEKLEKDEKLNPIGSRYGWQSKSAISIGKGIAMSIPNIMQDLYNNREKYGLPKYIHLPKKDFDGHSKAPWGALDPKRDESNCKIAPVAIAMQGTKSGVVMSREEAFAAAAEMSDQMALKEKFAKQKNALEAATLGADAVEIER